MTHIPYGRQAVPLFIAVLVGHFSWRHCVVKGMFQHIPTD
jgi:hypothetical protein